MRILFIGGTGRLSKDVAKLSLERGHEVFVLTRGSNNRKIFSDESYHMIYADIRDSDKCRRLLEKLYFDVVVDFLSFSPENIKNKLSILNNKHNQYIFISSATVYNNSENEVINEMTTSLGNDKWQYAYNKYLCEKYLECCTDSFKPNYYTIVRPYVTYGDTRVPYPLVPRDSLREWSLVNRILLGKPIATYDNGTTITTITHTRDFAVGLVGLFNNTASFNECIHITSDATTTWGNVLDILGKILECNVNTVDFSKKHIVDMMPEYQGVIMGDKGRCMRFDNSKIKSIVPDFECKILLENGLEKMICWYFNNPLYQLLDEDWDIKMDKLCKDGKI